jgi:hypothetical protein
MLFTRHTFVRSLHDLGAAAWFGGSLMGAIGLNGASEAVKDPSDRVRAATVGWAKWWPVSAAAVGAHLIGGAALLSVNSPRVGAQKGVGTSTVLKTALTAGAIGATAYNGVLGAKIAQGAKHEESAESAVTPDALTPSDVAAAQKQQRVMQWVTPALVGGVIVLGAQQGEMQRDSQLKKGLLGRILPG